MNIILINHYAGSPYHGMEYRPFYLAREWVKIGHEVTIIAASYSHVRSQQPKVSDELTQEEIDGIRYIWLKTHHYKCNDMRRIFNMLNFVAYLFLFKNKIAKKCKPEVVIASSTYPLDIYPAHYIARRANAKLFFEVHDLWPLSPIELGGMSPYHPFIMVMQKAENYAYRVSERVISILPNTKKHMVKHGMAPEKFVYVPNGIDVDLWNGGNETLPREYEEVLSSLKKKGNIIIGYAGAHGLANSLSSLIDSAALLQSQPVTYVLVGRGPEKEILKQKVLQLGLSNVIFLPPVPQRNIPQLLQMMDLLFIGLKKQPLFRFGVSPNKLMDYMMTGKPVIYAIDSDNDIVSESGCGFSVPPENSEEIASAIVQFMRMSVAERESMGLRGKDYVMTHYDYKRLAQQFLEAITN